MAYEVKIQHIHDGITYNKGDDFPREGKQLPNDKDLQKKIGFGQIVEVKRKVSKASK
jgi:hypothetical protein